MGKTIAAQNIIAITDEVSNEDAGAIYWWELSGPVHIEELTPAWEDAGYKASMLPHPPEPDTACLRAVREEKDRQTLRRSKRTGGRGQVLVDAGGASDVVGDTYGKVKATASVDKVGRIVIDCEDTEMADRITAAYDRHLFSELDTNDIGGWVSRKLIPLVDGIPLRSSGGFYFIPAQHLATWKAMIAVIEEVSSHKFYLMRALNADADGMRSILAGVVGEAKRAADSMWDEIAKGEKGERALETQAGNCDALKDKVTRYEKLLGAALPELQEQLSHLKANLAAAALKAGEGDDYTDLAAMAGLL